MADRPVQLYRTYKPEEEIGHALEFCARATWVVSLFNRNELQKLNLQGGISLLVWELTYSLYSWRS